MKLRYLYLLNSVVALLFALGMFLITSSMLAMFGFNDTPDTELLAKFLAVELVVSGLVTLLARDMTDRATRSIINYSHLVADVLGFIIALNATLTGVMNGMGYVIVAIYFILSVGYAYFQFFGPVE
jgi:hypothetical protein